MFRTLFVLSACYFLFAEGYSQNLVNNGGFEDLHECPKGVSSLAKIGVNLSSPTAGTTDIFSHCGSAKVGVPKNFRGTQNPKLGNTYAGLYLFSSNDYREYIQLSLKEPLVAGRSYNLQFYVSLAETSTVATAALNVLFANGPVQLGTSKNLSKSRLIRQKGLRFNFLDLNWKGSFLEKDEWVGIDVQFTAKGFERYIILGNFRNDGTTVRKSTKKDGHILKEFAYYYIDEISLCPERPLFEKGEPYVIEGVNFDTDSYQLSEEAKQKIRELYGNIKELSKIKVTINGHTDDQGGELHNEFLSRNRARAVASFLVALGFPSQRIVWAGHGQRQPLIPELTKEARRENRRVDFVITDFEDQ